MFESLQLASPILETLGTLGFSTPTPIQAGAIPAIRSGRDIVGQAQTGSGKTLAFGLPILEKLSARGASQFPGAMVMLPTRDLADQVRDMLAPFLKRAGLKSEVLVGGDNVNASAARLREGVDLVVGTPGRACHLLRSGALNLSQIQIAVIDEADRMLESLMVADLRELLSKTPPERQTLMFSATFPNHVRPLIRDLLRDPLEVTGALDGESHIRIPQQIRQVLIECDNASRFPKFVTLLRRVGQENCIAFTNSKDETESLSARLNVLGFCCEGFSSRLNTSSRRHRIQRLRDGKNPLAIATDILGRGMDFPDIPIIINFRLPHNPEAFIHRSGRTGRMGRDGIVYSFVNREELLKIQTAAGKLGIALETLALEPDPATQPRQIPNGHAALPEVSELIPNELKEILTHYDEGLSALRAVRAFSELEFDVYRGYPTFKVPSGNGILSVVAAEIATVADSQPAESTEIWRHFLAHLPNTVPFGEACAHFGARMLTRKLLQNGISAELFALSTRNKLNHDLWDSALEIVSNPIANQSGLLRPKFTSLIPETEVVAMLNDLVREAFQFGLHFSFELRGEAHSIKVKCKTDSKLRFEFLISKLAVCCKNSGWRFEVLKRDDRGGKDEHIIHPPPDGKYLRRMSDGEVRKRLKKSKDRKEQVEAQDGQPSGESN